MSVIAICSLFSLVTLFYGATAAPWRHVVAEIAQEPWFTSIRSDKM